MQLVSLTSRARDLWIYPDARRARMGEREHPGARCWTVRRLLDAFEPQGHLVSAVKARGLLASKLEGRPAFLREAWALVLALKKGRVTPEAFRGHVAAFPAESRPGALVLARAYAAYEQTRSQDGLLDEADLWSWAWARLSDGLPPALEGLRSLQVLGLYAPYPLERDVFLRLAQACQRAGVGFQLHVPTGGGGRADQCSEPLFQLFEQHPELPPTAISLEEAPEEAASRVHLSRTLAESSATAVQPRPCPGLSIPSYANVRDEARELARRVRRWVADGVPPHRIAVAFPADGPAFERLRAELTRFGVACRPKSRGGLSHTEEARVVLELGRLASRHFPSRRVAFLLSHPLLSALGPESGRPAGVLLRLAGIRDDRLGAQGEKGAYQLRLAALVGRLESRGRGAEASAVAALAARFERLKALCQTLSHSPARDARWGAHLEALLRALSQLGWDSRPQTQTLFAALEEAQDVLTPLASRRTSREGFFDWLEDFLEDLPLPAAAEPGVGVHLLSLTGLPGLSLDCLCVGGLSESSFPLRPPERLPLTDEEKALVNRRERREVLRHRVGTGDERTRWEEAESRLLLGYALQAPHLEVSLSFARRGEDGGEQGPSSLLVPLLERVGPPSWTAPFPALAPEHIARDDELRVRVGLELSEVAAVPGQVGNSGRPLARALVEALETEPWVARAREAAAVERERHLFFRDDVVAPGPYSGAVMDEGLRQTLARELAFGPDAPLSATTLERYARCGFQGFARELLRVGERESLGEAMDSRGRGSFLHLVFEELVPLLERRARGGELPSDSELKQAVATAASRAEREVHVGHPGLWRATQARAYRVVKRLLSSEGEILPFPGLVPSQTELLFGDARAPTGLGEVAVPLPGHAPLHLKGKIDRVDLGPGGVGVIDYKSGRVSASEKGQALLRTEFQLPMYLWAARQAHPGKAVSAAWISLRSAKAVTLDEALKVAKLTGDELLEGLPSAVHTLVDGLREGSFGPRTEDCGFCELASVCRIHEKKGRV
jgi:RecB family exonuclease